LSARELEVAALIADGLSNAEIARRLYLTSGTVANHVRRILARLGAHSRVDVARWYLLRYVVSPPIPEAESEGLGQRVTCPARQQGRSRDDYLAAEADINDARQRV
jgi:DNA-binding CsgD family transcriptional regulator